MVFEVHMIVHNIYNNTAHLWETYLLHLYPLCFKETFIIFTQIYVYAADILMQLEGGALSYLQQINVL